MKYIWTDSDNRFTLSGVYDNVNAQYINDATVTGTISLPDTPDTAVDATLEDMAFSAVGSSGNYTLDVTKTQMALLEIKTDYLLTVTIVSGSYQLVVRESFRSKYKDG